MKLYTTLLAVCAMLMASCTTTTPTAKSVCPVADRDIRVNSCTVRHPEKTPLGVLFAWAEGAKIWKKGDNGLVTLEVAFLDGSTKQKDLAWQRFAKVDALAEGLVLVRSTDTQQADIRVSFACQGHWSFVGTDCRRQSPGTATMNLELSATDVAKEWDRVAIHEMLHALGFGHEHQHPYSTIPWDYPAVFAFYKRTQGWDEATTRYQVTDRADPEILRTSGEDKDSLMMYPIQPELTNGQLSVGWNTVLSVKDIILLKELYPAPNF